MPLRRPKSTITSDRARYSAAAIGALLLSTLLAPSVLAMQAAAPDAATKAAIDKRLAARTMLSSALGRLATNANDGTALLDAGRASIELEDYRAAVGFLARAEQANPRDGSVKAALGSAMVHMENPTRALDYFGEAQLLGAPERVMLADRGLARDLLGQQDAAQRDYQLALSIAPGNDELVRRFALSLGISGDPDRAVAMLTPQLRAQNRAAWRSRAMILAMNGRDKEATEIVHATMPAQLAQNILPYLTQMDRLNPAQQAAAAHFGRFPSGQLGPKRAPVQVAAATPQPTPAPAATTSSRRRPSGTVLPAPVRSNTTAQTRPVTITTVPTAAPPVSPAAPPVSATSNPAPTPVPTSVAAPPASQPPALQSPFRSAVRPASAVPPAPSPTVSAPAPSAVPKASPATETVAPAPVAPATPGFSIADIGRETAGTSATASLPVGAPAAAVSAPAPLASLAEIAGSIEIPAEELNRPDNAIGADTLAKLQDDRRKAVAAEAVKREKDEAAAKAKAEADAKAKEEAAQKKAHPARLWVQVATGANARALAADYAKFAKKSPDVFKGKSAATTEWGRTRRLLVGPFKDRKAAQDWLASYKKAGGDGFLFNSEVGQEVDPVK